MNAAAVVGGLAAPLAWGLLPSDATPIPTSVRLVGFLMLALFGAFGGMIVVALGRLLFDTAARGLKRL